MINIFCSSRYKIERIKIKQEIKKLLLEKNLSPDWSINIIFVGKNKMKKISQTYKNENIALPVLSFPYREKQDEKFLLGEIFICYPQAVLLAAQRNKKVDEIILSLIKHGIDHLLK